MRFNPDREADADIAQLLIEELLRCGLVLTGGLAALSDGNPPERERTADSLFELITATCHPVVVGAGRERCLDAITLIQEIRQRFLNDLRRVAEDSPEGRG